MPDITPEIPSPHDGASHGDSHRLLTPREEAHLFWKLRGTLLKTMVRQALACSRLRISLLVLLSAIFWSGLYQLFIEGFHLLETTIAHEPTRALTVQRIYNVFFLTLMAMLTISSSIIFYSSLYRNEEILFLLTTPARTGRIVLSKFQEGVLYSGWGFALVGSPMLIAYGVTSGAPWYYFAMLPPFMISFVFLPASAGALLCLLVLYYIPAIRLQSLMLAGCLLAATVVGLGWALLAGQNQALMTPMWLEHVLGRLQFAEQRVLPSWWLSSGLLEAAHPAPAPHNAHAWRESVLFLTVLLSNAMLFVLIVQQTGQQYFLAGYSRLQGIVTPERRRKAWWPDRLLMLLAWPLPLSVRVLVLKDLRLFRRDPLQWSQFLIFFSLLGLYFLNIDRFQYGRQLVLWMNLIGFLNLGVVGLILSTFTTRFIFPMISLEGRRFWILGTLPVRRDTILWSKFLFACATSIVPCAILIFLSDTMLGIRQTAPHFVLVHQIVCGALCVGLSAIAVGLGARLPNLRETSSAKIAAGFGGTLNLVLSGIFIIAVVLVTAVPCYFYLQAQQSGAAPLPISWWPAQWCGLGTMRAVNLGIAATIVLGMIATVLPLTIGIRWFRRLEF